MKIFRKLGIERIFLILIKSICEKPTTDIIFNSDSLNVFLLESRTQGFLPLTFRLKIIVGYSASAMRQKESKMVQKLEITDKM